MKINEKGVATNIVERRNRRAGKENSPGSRIAEVQVSMETDV